MATITTYHNYLLKQYTSSPIDWASDQVRVALMTEAYEPNVTVDTFYSDINASEVSGTGYTSGGKGLTGVAVTQTGGEVKVDADDVTWAQTASGFNNARYGVLYKDSGSSTTSLLYGYIDFGTLKGVDSTDFIISWNDLGVFTVSGVSI